jgi:hypothetical protein
MRALTVRGRVSTRVRAGAFRQATFSSTLIVGARVESLSSPSASLALGAAGPFLPPFDELESAFFDAGLTP